jgi:predicted RNA-binding protein with PUA-like domain
MAQQFWLFKSEPNAYSFDDLLNDGIAEWDGVRNFQVRNWLRDAIKEGDGVLFYHSNTSPLGVVGTAAVVKEGYPDFTAWDPDSEHPDPKSTPEKPIWYMVDLKADKRFTDTVTVDDMRAMPELNDMVVLKRGNRLSITPATEAEFETVVKMGLAK